MSEMKHERPGVYSVYDASAVVTAGRGNKTVGVAARAARGTVGEAVTVTGYAAGVAAFGEDAAPGMSTILRLLFSNGAATVVAVRVAEEGTLADYEAAFEVLGRQDAQIVVCDSADLTVQQALRTAVETASSQRRERIAVVGGSGDTAAELVTRAAALNCERMVLVGPDALDSAGNRLAGVFAAAALAGVLADGGDPAVPLNGAEMAGLGGLAEDYSDNDIDLLVRGGVTPLESAAGIISPVRGITTREQADLLLTPQNEPMPAPELLRDMDKAVARIRLALDRGECIAVYGKFLNSYLTRKSSEMFFDITPGTPPIYRRDLLTKLYTVGYDVEDNIMFGTDSLSNDYNPSWVAGWLARDKEILDDLGVTEAQREKLYEKNFFRFIRGEDIEHTLPQMNK